MNVIVVGKYLYDKTDDVDYLIKSASILEGVRGEGLQAWLRLRQEREGGDLLLAAQKSVSDKKKDFYNYDSRDGVKGLIKGHDLFQRAKAAFLEEQSDLISGLQRDHKISLEDTQAGLAKDSSAIISFYLYDTQLYRLLARADTIAVDILSKDKNEAVELAGVLAEEAKHQGGEVSFKKNSRRLFEILFQGIREELPERVTVVAGKELSKAPFAVLRMDAGEEEARYFGVEHAISRQFSIRSQQMLEEADLNPKYEQPLALAPAFQSEWLLAGELRQAGFVIPPLKYNQEEVEKLSDRSGGRFLTGETATVANYKKYAKDYSLIHLATHAISSEEDGLKSHILLLDDKGSPEPLYASEIGDETLNADLVVLSACETGGGLLHEMEGTVGLTKAYLAAGARSVVASSWAVDDYATAELMNSFYEALSVGGRPDDALRDARAAYLQKYPDARPDKWGAFEAYGGMKAPSWDKSKNPLKGIWIWLLAGLGLFVAIMMVRKMKHA